MKTPHTRSIVTAATVMLAATFATLAPIYATASGNHAHHHAATAHTAIGQPGDATKVTRTIDVDMQDSMRFTPSAIAVRRGETIRFKVKNSGKLRHEMMLGTTDELRAHAEIMRKMPQMAHTEANAVTVDPGKTGELIWHFTQSGDVPFGCLAVGHFEAGMMGKITVGG